MEDSNERAEINLRRTSAIKFTTPWGVLEMRGLGTLLFVGFLVLSLTSYMVWEGKEEHSRIVNSLSSLNDALAEQTYILSLTVEDREKLKITMPSSLRAKIRKGDQ